MSRVRDAILVKQLREKDKDLRTAREALHAVQLEIRLLRQKLDALEMMDEVQAAALVAGKPMAQHDVKAAPARERGPCVTEHLPVKEIIVDPEEVKASPGQWKCIGEEVTEQLDYTPGSFTRLHIVRRKYVHRMNRYETPVIAPLSPTLRERCLAEPSLLAHAFVSRYRDHLPWYRLESIYAGLGVIISRQTLGN